MNYHLTLSLMAPRHRLHSTIPCHRLELLPMAVAAQLQRNSFPNSRNQISHETMQNACWQGQQPQVVSRSDLQASHDDHYDRVKWASLAGLSKEEEWAVQLPSLPRQMHPPTANVAHWGVPTGAMCSTDYPLARKEYHQFREVW